MEIGFNSKFVIEMLSNIGADQIGVEMSAPNRAGLFYHWMGKMKESTP